MSINSSRLFYILSEALLIFLAAILGEFVWENGQEVFNAGISGWWGELVNQITLYWPAYLAITIVFVGLLVVLYYRAKRDGSIVTRNDFTKLSSESSKKIDDLVTELKRENKAETDAIYALVAKMQADRESENDKQSDNM